MSRSRRKTPITPTTGAPSDKPYKRAEHHRERAQVKAKLVATSDDTKLPSPKLYGDPWDGDKDGKLYRGRAVEKKALRK